MQRPACIIEYCEEFVFLFPKCRLNTGHWTPDTDIDTIYYYYLGLSPFIGILLCFMEINFNKTS